MEREESNEKLYGLSGVTDFDQFIAVFKDLTYKKYLHFDDAMLQHPMYIAKQTILGIHEFRGVNYPVLSFEVLSDANEIINLNLNDWQIVNIERKKHWGLFQSTFIVKSPDLEVRKFCFNNFEVNTNLEGFMSYVKFILQFKEYKDWTYYDLMKENESLKQQIEDLSNNV